MRNRLALVLAIGGLSALVSAPAAFAGWQDTNICDVPSADFTTIQSAIDQPLCFTVRLGVATFREQLTIHRSLTLGGQTFEHGDERFVSRLRPPDGMVDPLLIKVVGARTRAKIKHIVIERGDVNPDGLIGLWAGRDTRVTIKDCVFRDMRPSTPDARWAFWAMFLGGRLQPKTKVGITGHSITNCRFYGYQNAAIVVEGVGTTATIDHNLIDAKGNANTVPPTNAASPIGVLAFDGASVTISRNDLVNNSREGGGGAAILLIGAAASSVISSNNIDGNDLGIGLDGTSSAEIYRNGISSNGMGMLLGWATASDSNAILLNRIAGGGTGVYLGQARSNSISSNNLLGNTSGHGVLLSAGASENTVSRNRSDNNGFLGYADWSLGAGTSGTANTYTANICGGNNGGGGQSWPPDLCR